MAKSFADLIDDVQSYLDDDGTLFTDAYVKVKLWDALRQFSEYVPYVRKVSFFIESRTGTATTDIISYVFNVYLKSIGATLVVHLVVFIPIYHDVLTYGKLVNITISRNNSPCVVCRVLNHLAYISRKELGFSGINKGA